MRSIIAGSVAVSCFLLTTTPRVASPQTDMRQPIQMHAGPLGIPETRMGSGTSWLPDSAPMHAAHYPLGKWTIMLHGLGFLQYDWQGGPRGSNQVGFTNWAMAMATRPVSGGHLQLRAMLSAEPWTIGTRGYPLLLQTGETYQAEPLHDRQHPHDLFMELAALYERSIARNLGISLYVAPVGEPALGPVAFPHRPSAAGDPLAPLSHHWQDGTHITFGVLTAGVFTRAVKLETSWFNGQEPDENRTNFDYRDRRLDSYSTRLSVNPNPRWSVAASYAYVETPEALHPGESLHRVGLSVLSTQTLGEHGTWSTALIYGANDPIGSSPPSPSLLVESSLDLGRNWLFGRAEYVRKSAEDLVVASEPPGTAYDIAELVLGFMRELGQLGGVEAGIGVRGSVNFVPAGLEAEYGSRAPAGVAVYFRLRPSGGKRMEQMPGMHEHNHD